VKTQNYNDDNALVQYNNAPTKLIDATWAVTLLQKGPASPETISIEMRQVALLPVVQLGVVAATQHVSEQGPKHAGARLVSHGGPSRPLIACMPEKSCDLLVLVN
jgi:hypothetical protein